MTTGAPARTGLAATDGWIDRSMAVGWWCVMTLLPIGHLTGLRNTVTTIVVLATLVRCGRDCWRGLPARWWALALLGWCAASIGWSSVPAISFGKWRVDLLLPLLAYAAAFGYVRRTGRVDTIVGGTITGMVALAMLSLPALLPPSVAAALAQFVRTDVYATVSNPMPVWFPGVGDASMAATLVTVGVLLAARLVPAMRPGRVAAAWVVAGLAILLVLVAINNRNATVTIPIVVLFAAWLDRRRSKSAAAGGGPRRHRRAFAMGAIAAIALFGSLALLESGARQRLQQMGTAVGDGESGLVVLTGRDTRPMIWAHYHQLALKHPWIGVGFGRTVPGITYRTQDDGQLARIEANAYAHAHNVLLNWWLQTGVVGVVLLLATLVTIVVTAWARAGPAQSRRRAASSTVVALVAATLLRNMTDDFLIFGMASMFWILVGTFGAAGLRDARTEDSFSATRAP